MLILAGKRRRRRVHVVGGGFLDWIPSTLASASRFIIANKDNIKNVADVVGSVARAGAMTRPRSSRSSTLLSRGEPLFQNP